MKKTFFKPVLTRYSLNSKENIVASVAPFISDASLKASWDFIHTLDADNNSVDPDLVNQGCFNLFHTYTDEDIIANGYLSTASRWHYFLGKMADAVGHPDLYQYWLICAHEDISA